MDLNGTRSEDSGEDYLMMSFMIYTAHQVLLKGER